jgi:hypothetical protein
LTNDPSNSPHGALGECVEAALCPMPVDMAVASPTD